MAISARHRALLAGHLRVVDGHIVLGLRHIARQREIIDKLRLRRCPTDDAEFLLAMFKQTQASHIAHRDRLRTELGEELIGRRTGCGD